MASLKSDYLNGAADLRSFYRYDLRQPNFAEIIRDKAQNATDREALHRALSEQYATLPAEAVSPRVREAIDALRQPDTFTLTTGHQTVLFGGPLYTIYKVVSVIRLADDLNRQGITNPHTGNRARFVPIFWIHVEDHDFEEINHFYSSFEQKHTYRGDFGGTAVGFHRLTEEIERLVPAHFSEILRRCWQAGKTLAQAYFEFANALFGEYGCVVLNPMHTALKAQFSPILERELREQFSYQALLDTNRRLAELGYPIGVGGRNINLFSLDQHGRTRIEAATPELLAKAQTAPWAFSPNVVLRPLYQEMILPNLAYCGGWGEIGYWLQLRGVFEAAGVNFPLLLPRMGATLFRPEAMEAWQKLGFAPADVQLSSQELYNRYLPNLWDAAPYEALERELFGNIQQIGGYLSEISATLPNSLRALEVKNRRYLENLRKKVQRVVRSNNPAPFAEIDRLKHAIQPDGAVQERVLSLAAFPDRQPDALVRFAYEACQPLDMAHRYGVV